MSAVTNLSRRGFLKAGAIAGGGLVLGVYLPQLNGRAHGAEEKFTRFQPNAFVRIGADDSITVLINHSEMGQGTMTSLALLVAEELDADWKKIRAEHAGVDPAYNHVAFGMQMVGGSTSTWTEWERLRKAGATARAMLIEAAAKEWNVDARDCTAENSVVNHAASGKSLSFGALAEKASHLDPPDDVALKDPKLFKLIGKPTKRLDTPEKVNGSGVFGIDVKVPGMLVAVIARSPTFGGKVKSFNAEKAKAISGVKHVVQIERGVAVVADGFYPAKLGRESLEITWDEGPLATLDSKTQGEQYAELAKTQGAIATKSGNVANALASAPKKIEAIYETPYLAHAPMEPMNCVADVRADSCEVWTGTQFQTADRAAAAQITGLSPEQVNVHTMLLGGGFGRRAVGDCHMVREAVEISKAIKTPVKVVWTREDDTRGGYYRPRTYHTIAAALDANDKPSAWKHRIVCQSFIVGTPFEPFIVKDGVDGTAVEGAADLPYAIPNLLVDWQMAPAGVPCLWWRSVGHSQNAFVVETFIDELAHLAGKDPFEFRRALLEKNARYKRVLEFVADKAGWGKPLPEGRGRGIAVHESFGSFVGQVAEVSVSPQGKVRVHRVVLCHRLRANRESRRH
jgi:isoquinoline 1-oxidoreductase beta subunit